MAEVILSILIPTIVGRESHCEALLSNILKQSAYNSATIQLVVFKDNKEITIGQKRQELYQSALGRYSWQIDDDDGIDDDALELILKAADASPDCITFEERCDMNGEIKRANHSLKYDKWEENFDRFDFVRTPFYKNVIKTEIAKSVPFPHIRWNEDEQWSMALKPHLKSEVHIDKQLYLYSYYPTESHEERYGLNK